MPDPFDLERMLEMAISHHLARELKQAEALYRDLLVHDPNNLDALNLLSVVLQDLGRAHESLELVNQALVVDPVFAEAFAHKARALNLLRRPDEAVLASQRAIEIDPELGEAWQQLGLAYLNLNQAQAALDVLLTASGFLPNSSQVKQAIAEAAMALREYETLVEVLPDLLAENPDHIEIMINLGIALAALDRLDDAIVLHRRAVELAPDDSRALVALAVTMHKQPYDVAALEALCRRTLAINPNNLDMRTMLGEALIWLGRFDEAAAALREALELQPDDPTASWLLASLTTNTAAIVIDDAAEIARLAAHFEDTGLPAAIRVNAGFAVGKRLDRAGNYDAAFEVFKAANGLAKARLATEGHAFDPAYFERYVDWAKVIFDEHLFTTVRPWENSSDLPVFVVGMPRSGTSLVEQIVSSHPRVFGAGERKDISGIMARISMGNSPQLPLGWDLSLTARETAEHIEMLRILGGDAARVIDKLPDNILVLGHISLLFPNARIIVCRRDLRDVCLSCFINNFNSVMPWTCDMEHCASRAVGVERLLDHWRSIIPTRFIEVTYETLVQDLEGESRRLIEFLGLDWDPACLNFDTNPRQVTTVSYWQVRQPLYDSSIGRWRRYENHIKPMMNILKDYVPMEFGTSARR
jgi:tetratricopeptide (TPR) repeat protein